MIVIMFSYKRPYVGEPPYVLKPWEQLHFLLDVATLALGSRLKKRACKGVNQD